MQASIPADMNQLLRIKAAQVSQQIHLAGDSDLVFGHIGQCVAPFLLFRVNANDIKYIFRAFLAACVLAFSCSHMINYKYLQILSAQGE